MKRQWSLTVMMGALVLGGLLTAGCASGSNPAIMAQSAGAIDLNGPPAQLG